MTHLRWAASRVLVGMTLLAAFCGRADALTAGAFQFVAGDVQLILAAGGQRPATKGSPISVGDTIATARDAMAQLKMGDGGIIVVQPESRLTVAEFHYTGAEDGTEKVLYRLERGGFRAVTGAIGHTHKENYLIETPIAHIGIRGTDHESYYFPAENPSDGNPAPAGVYNKVNVGLSYIRTRSGEVVIGPNQVGYAATAQDAPALLPTMPGFFNRAFEPRKARGTGAELALTRPPQIIQPVIAANGVTLGGRSTAPAGAGSGSVVAYIGLLGAAPQAQSGINLAVSPNGATLTNAGSDPAFGVNWGSWPGGVALVGGNVTVGSVHFAESTQLTTAAQLAALPPGLVNATYSYVGGPAPTDHLGTQGAITALTVGVNFGTQTVTNYAVSANIGATSWNASGSGSFTRFTGGSGIPINGTCTGCLGPPVAANGTAQGAFVGSAAEKMITAFGLKAATSAMAGTAYLSR